MSYLLASLSGSETAAPTSESDAAFSVSVLRRNEAPLVPDTSGRAIVERFRNVPSLSILAVVDQGRRPVGMVTRAMMAPALSSMPFADGWSAQPAAGLMDTSPLLIDADTDSAILVRILCGQMPAALTAGFIVVRQGRYDGIVNGTDLLAATVAIAARQAEDRARALAAADVANRAKTAFLANASHEIRTPLNAIMGFAELLAGEALGPLGHPRYVEYAADIVTGGGHLMELINDLLDLSKAEADRLDLNESLCELARLVATTLRLVTERAAKNGIALHNHVSLCGSERKAGRADGKVTQMAGPLPPLLADERKARQMLLNLLSNALKFTHEGGNVSVFCTLADDGLRLSVQDDGIGMSQEELAHALEPWGQIDHAINRRTTGTGLGLPLTQRLIELHGGRLEITTAPGQGTVMTLLFPDERVCRNERSKAAE